MEFAFGFQVLALMAVVVAVVAVGNETVVAVAAVEESVVVWLEIL